MRYVVFSFDDGLIDFKDNALPIMKKYGIVGTINVISGFSDLSVPTSYKYLSANDIKELHEHGFEIANHTNSHLKYGSYEELKICNDKINNWCNSKNALGIAMPKYARPSETSKRFIKEVNPPYVTYEKQRVISLKNFTRRIYWKIISIIRKKEVNLLTYSIQRKIYKLGHSKEFQRLEVGKNINPQLLYESLKTIKDGWCLTLCFHSIVDDVESTSYPKGSCTIDQFEKICNLIHKDQTISIIKQIDTCRKM